MYTPNSFVTVITPVYNGERYLEQAIESALGQTYRNFELILVDDCSSDQSTRIIRQHLSNERIVFLQNEKNMGVAASRNHALKFAKGDLITFLDQDDIWLPNKLVLQVSAIEKHPDIGLLHAGYARIDPSGELLSSYRQLPPDRFGNVSAQIDVRDVFG
ncbi:MAG TPA: glycosyltransferase family A protein, partial [Halomonas sp.]|nr:glycosyltransferase family A protein [Halomonas sp.]